MDYKNDLKQKKERLLFLIDRYNFRLKMFMEFCWVDERIIPDIKKFGKENNEIFEEIAKLKEEPNIIIKKEKNG